MPRSDSPSVAPPPPGQAAGAHHAAAGDGGYRAGPAWMRVLPSLVMAAAGLWGIGGASYWRDEAATLTAVHRSFGQ
ncbi:MAG TPA: hypothetical protein VH637_10240, partial [Streptosporangiaceae bacterium]